MLRINKVLISDDIDVKCVELLKANSVQVDVKTKLTKEQLCSEIVNYDALLVRSATKVTEEVLRAGKQLKLIGRAGTGVDNIDVPAATRHGVVVMNTPSGNSRSAAELTCAMLMCLARQVPQAHLSMNQGRWDRKLYMGNELYGKTLAIIGLGRIGREVATRMQAFGMKTIGYDPIISVEQAASFNVESLSLEQIWPQADYVTVHVPLIPATKNLINIDVMNKCKKNVKFVNCARGGIINEEDLVTAFNAGQVAGAAFDVFEQEPPTNRSLIEHPKMISTPHLGASTHEAQSRVAVEIAENIVELNAGRALLGAINGAPLTALLDPKNRPWLKCIEDLTIMLQGANKNSLKLFKITITKDCESISKALKASCVIGCLKAVAKNGLNMINAELIAAEAGVKVDCAIGDFEGYVSVSSGQSTVSGCPTTAGTLVTSINEQATSILCRNVIAVNKNGSDLPAALKGTNMSQTTAANQDFMCFANLSAAQTSELESKCQVLIKF